MIAKMCKPTKRISGKDIASNKLKNIFIQTTLFRESDTLFHKNIINFVAENRATAITNKMANVFCKEIGARFTTKKF